MAEIDIGVALRAFRRRIDLTQEELAKKLGLKRTTYTAYEQGIAQPPQHVLTALEGMGFKDEVGPPMIPASQLLIPITYIGSVSASSEVDWTDPFESETMEFVPPEMGAARGRFCCRVASDSCYDLLWPGDIAVFQRSDEPRPGLVILFRSHDNRITIKQLRKSGMEFILHPLNPKYEDCPADGTHVGYLVGIIRQSGSRRVTVFDSEGIKP